MSEVHEINPDLDERNLLRVSAGSNATSVASAIAHAIYENREVKIRYVGAGAGHQAVKAVAIASGYVAPRGLRLALIPGFVTIEGKEGKISANTLHVFCL